MKKCLKLLSVVLLGLMIAGATGCKEDEAGSVDSMMKKAADHPDVQVPKDHPAH